MKKISILTIVFVVFASSFAIGQGSLKNITLEDIWTNYSFYPRSVRGINSLNNGKHYTMNKSGTLIVYDYKTGDSITTLIQAEELIPKGAEKPIKMGAFTMSDDESKFLIPSETESIYRHSSQSKYYIWDTQNKKLDLLSSEKQRLADFAPDGNKVAFIRNNNIFVKNLKNDTELQITDDGKFNSIINGTCDWVYEEEFGFTKAFFWSPDGKKIAYYRFDESAVKEYTITNYGELYPELYTYKYPKAGEDNSIVEIFVFDIESGQTIKMDIGDETDQYIPRIKWTNDPNLLAIQRLNRLQNHLDILMADASTGKSQIVYTEDNKYYIDITDNLTFLPGNKQFIITSEKDGFNHIYLYNINGAIANQLTSGEWEVRSVYGYDAKKKQVFYQASEESPLIKDIYKVDLKGRRAKLSTRVGTNDAAFSKNYDYYINTWKDAATPPVITVNLANGKQVRTLEDNQKLVEKMKKYKLGKQEFFTISSPEFTLPDGKQVDLNAWAIYPPDFDKTKKYPVLITIYGGPGSQEVTNSFGYFNYFWYQMLAQNGILVVSVDNRGTGARGEEFKKMTYLELGKYETIDYIETAKYLGSLDYIDENRIGIFGWSYGGFMAANALFQGADYFNTAIAVAPVTNWRYYDNIYTERFMRTPQENPDGYDNNSPINHVAKMKGNFLLVHGSADDNVHFQNTMDLVTALVNENKQFELMAYPNKNHGIYGGNTRYHLFKKMTDFLYENLKEKTDLSKLISFMEGSFSSEEQAKADTNYLHITLDMQQIWKGNTDGAWLYVEQTAAWTPGKPYRQRIYHLEQLSDSTFSSSIYKMPNQETFVGGHSNPEVFEAMSPDSLSILEGCALLLTYKNGVFAGSTVEGACINAWGEASYATSEVSISQDVMNSWDRGWNDNKEQVWGAEKGGYKFVRVETIK